MGGLNGKENEYTQPALDGFDTPETAPTELENCLVLTRPVFKDTGKKQEWTCSIHAQPSLFQPDINAVFLALATNKQAKLAKRKGIKPGDRVLVKGIVRTETLTYPTEDTKILYTITLTDVPVVTAKETRVSTTVFEQREAKSRGNMSNHRQA